MENGRELVFTEEELAQFEDWGFVKLSHVFTRETAEACRSIIQRRCKEQSNADFEDSSSWPRVVGVKDVFTSEDDAPWRDVITSRLTAAVNEILGEGAWNPFGIGWWVVSFPLNYSSSSAFEVEGAWHIDGGSLADHSLLKREIALIPIMLFSDIRPNAGATCVLCGSHKVAVRILSEAGAAGMRAGAITERILATHNEDDEASFEVVELTGEMGDVIFLHPLLVHARSRNNGAEGGVNSIRIICHPTISLREKMTLHPAYSSSSSTVKKASALQTLLEKTFQDNVSADYSLHSVDPAASEDSLHQTNTNHRAESVSDECLQALGFNSFRKRGKEEFSRRKRGRLS